MTASKLTWFDAGKCFIGGRWVRPRSSGSLPIEDPSRGIEIGEIARGTAADIDAAVEAAERALHGPWGRLTAAERGRLLAKLAELVNTRVDELARIEAFDVGKPLKQGRADALALARYMEFYAGAADKVMGETIPYLGGYTVYTLREPHGVTGHIVPWNYPMQIAGRTVGAALAMGNACVLKPAEEACLTSLALADLAREAGFPDGALNVVPGLGEEAGAALAAHPGVSHLSFTGSVAVGALVQAAAARHVAPVTLELGGKSPQAVFADADLERALPFLVNAGIQNAGQTCSAASRILVERRRYSEVVERMAARYRSLKVGPADADLDVGPLISERQKAIVSRFISEGADLKTAATGEIVADAPRGGHYVAPTLFADVGPGHRLAQEEIFGPVQVVIPFDDEAEAVDDRQRDRLRPGRRRLDGRRGPPDAPRQSFARRAGVHQQLRRGRRRRAAVRRRRQIGPWPREGLRSALRLLGAENRRRVARVRRVLFACAVALTAAGCATPPVVKRDYSRSEGVARLGAHDLWPAAGCRRRRGPCAANGHADRRQRAGGGGGGRGSARPHSRPPGRERAGRAQPQRNCARRHRGVARLRAGRPPDLPSRRFADKADGRHRPLLREVCPLHHAPHGPPPPPLRGKGGFRRRPSRLALSSHANRGRGTVRRTVEGAGRVAKSSHARPARAC